MLKNKNISRYLSGFLLVVFIFSITPKRFLHNVFAKHTDSKSQSTTGKPYQLTTAGYNCDCDNLVAESNFIGEPSLSVLPVTCIFSSYTLLDISFSSSQKVYASLRGPPVVCNYLLL